MDKLQTMMQMQKDLQIRLGTNFDDMSPWDRAEFMRNHRGYLADEIAEALYEMPYYKLWKNYNTMTDAEQREALQKVKMELVDSFHFFMNLLLCAGFTADELYDMYMAKNKENHRRQDAGYTSDVSYRDQAVSDVMSDTNDTKCRVSIDGETFCSDDFISILNKADGPEMYYNTDALSLGIATAMCASRYYTELEKCSDEERELIHSTLDEMFGKEAVPSA